MKKYRVVIISILISIFFEIFVFNYPFFRSLFLGNNNLQANYEIQNNIIKISKIDKRVTSINFEYDKPLTDKVTYELSYITEGTSDAISINPKIILKDDKQYINFDTHSKCQTIEVVQYTESEAQIKNISLNHANINVSFIRIFIAFISIIFIQKFKSSQLFEKQYDKNSKRTNGIFLINLAVFTAFVLLYMICQLSPEKFIIKPEDIDTTDAILMQAEAIVNGKVELLEEPSEELVNMKDPYDHIKRDIEEVPYLYDVTYYDGHYYSYFGIAPVLTSVLPFRLITGVYTHTYIFNIIYIVISIFALYFLYRKLVDRYIEKISLSNFYLGFFAILFASNILTLFRGLKYEIVISSGIAFLLISLNLAISIYTKPKLKFLKLILLGITTALIVLSKPNLIVYYLLILFFILCSMKKLSYKEKVKDFVFAFVPLVVIAIFQMIWNYVRFDSILEFGAKYQLTGLNMQYCMYLTFGKVFAGIIEYLFRLPSINPLKFPFIFVNRDTALTAINEVCYEARLVGLMAIPIMWTYLLRGTILKENKNREFKWFINLILISVIVVMIITTCTGGICENYSIDFKLMLSMGAVLLLLSWNEKDDKSNTRKNIFVLMCVATIIIMIPIGFTTEYEFLTNFASDTTVFLKNIFEFWA